MRISMRPEHIQYRWHYLRQLSGWQHDLWNWINDVRVHQRLRVQRLRRLAAVQRSVLVKPRPHRLLTWARCLNRGGLVRSRDGHSMRWRNLRNGRVYQLLQYVAKSIWACRVCTPFLNHRLTQHHLFSPIRSLLCQHVQRRRGILLHRLPRWQQQRRRLVHVHLQRWLCCERNWCQPSVRQYVPQDGSGGRAQRPAHPCTVDPVANRVQCCSACTECGDGTYSVSGDTSCTCTTKRADPPPSATLNLFLIWEPF